MFICICPLLPFEKIKNILERFDQFELESHDNCVYDYLELREGSSSDSPLIGRWDLMGAPKNPKYYLNFFAARFCGTDLPPDYVSNSNQLHVTFRSDYSVSHSGFRFLISFFLIILVSNPFKFLDKEAEF